jgi:hypothetical protein
MSIGRFAAFLLVIDACDAGKFLPKLVIGSVDRFNLDRLKTAALSPNTAALR